MTLANPAPDLIDARSERFWIDLRPLIFAPDILSDAAIEVDHILAVSGVCPPAHVLDLGCGIGRHALAFARRGCSVEGIDAVRALIQEACDTAAAERLDARFRHGDIARLEAIAADSFDLAVSMYHSLGYSCDPADDLGTLRAVHRTLKPRGLFYLELLDPEGYSPGECRSAVCEAGGLSYRLTIEIDPSCRNYRLTIVRTDDEMLRYQASHRLFSAAVIKSMLADAGFRATMIDAPPGIMAKSPSRRLHLFAEKT
jgi:SAM-dependent methyltransferase